jgi:hypothetical protein
LHAIKADVVSHFSEGDLSVAAVAARHSVTLRDGGIRDRPPTALRSPMTTCFFARVMNGHQCCVHSGFSLRISSALASLTACR